MPQTHRPTIIIYEPDPGEFKARMSEGFHSFKARPGHRIKWRVEESKNFPKKAVVFLQFVKTKADGTKTAEPDDGCLIDGATKKGKHRGTKNSSDHFVNEHVAFDAAQHGYHYEIWYDDGRDHPLLDPEIVVDGSPDPTPVDHDDPVGGRPKTPRKPRQPAGKTGKSKPAAARRKATRKPAARKVRNSGKATLARRKPAKRKPARRKAKKR